MNRRTNNPRSSAPDATTVAGCQPSQQASEGLAAKTHSEVNAYAEVRWESYRQYKANLHAHTTHSDGSLAPHEVIDRYHALGYKVLSLTDHDTCGPPGCDKNSPSKHETTWPWQQFGREPGELGMIAVQGNEVGTDHILSYFNDYGSLADYDSIYVWDSPAYSYNFVDKDAEFKATEIAENTLEKIRDRDGLAVMAHVGIYVHPAQWYAQLFLSFDNLVGIEVYNYNARDCYPWSMTLWDELLTALMPARPVWGFSNDDLHRRDKQGYELGYAYQMLLLPELTDNAVSESMEKGCFYFCWVYERGKEAPAIKSIRIDRTTCDTPTLIIEAEDHQEILWISQGRTVAYGATFNITRSRGAKQYIRAQIRGKNGYTCTQPFSLPLVSSPASTPCSSERQVEFP